MGHRMMKAPVIHVGEKRVSGPGTYLASSFLPAFKLSKFRIVLKTRK